MRPVPRVPSASVAALALASLSCVRQPAIPGVIDAAASAAQTAGIVVLITTSDGTDCHLIGPLMQTQWLDLDLRGREGLRSVRITINDGRPNFMLGAEAEWRVTIGIEALPGNKSGVVEAPFPARLDKPSITYVQMTPNTHLTVSVQPSLRATEVLENCHH